LTLTFSAAITGLSANDITLSGVTGVNKGTLSGSGPTYTLPISGFTAGGTLSVAVTKAGYAISGSSQTAAIYYYSGGGGGGSEWMELISTKATSAPVYGFNLSAGKTFGNYDRIIVKIKMDPASPNTDGRLRAWGNYNLAAWTNVNNRPDMGNRTPGTATETGLLLNTADAAEYSSVTDWTEYVIIFNNREILYNAATIKAANGTVAVAFGIIASVGGGPGTRTYYVKDIVLSNAARTDQVPALNPGSPLLWNGQGAGAYVTQDGDVVTRTILPTQDPGTTKTQVNLAIPTLTINSTAKTASWNAVPNANAANGYTIKIGSTETQVTGTSYSLSSLAAGTYQISVKTNGYETTTHIYNASAYSSAQSFTVSSGSNTNPDSKTITWVQGSNNYKFALTYLSSDTYTYILSVGTSGYNTGTVKVNGNVYTLTPRGSSSTVIINFNISTNQVTTSGSQSISLTTSAGGTANFTIPATNAQGTVTDNTGGVSVNPFVGIWNGGVLTVSTNLTWSYNDRGNSMSGSYAFIDNTAIIYTSGGSFFGYASVSGNTMNCVTNEGPYTFTK